MHFKSNEEPPFIAIQLKLDFLTWDAVTGILDRKSEILRRAFMLLKFLYFVDNTLFDDICCNSNSQVLYI